MPNVGINVGPMLAALAVLAAVIKARDTGEGCEIEVAQSDASPTWTGTASRPRGPTCAPTTKVTGNPSDDYKRRPAGLAACGRACATRPTAASDGHVLFMASEQAFWRNFCAGTGRMDLFERWPGSTYADHARGNTELQRELKAIFATRTCAQWLAFSNEANTPIAPFNTPANIGDDP